MAKHAVAIGDYLEDAENFSNGLLVFKPQFSRRLSRIFFSASSRLSRNFRGRLTGLAQFAAGGRLSRRLRGLHIPSSNWETNQQRFSTCGPQLSVWCSSSRA